MEFKQELKYKNFEIKSVDLNEETNEMFIEGLAASYNTLDEIQPMITKSGEIVNVADKLLTSCASKSISERKNRIAICLNHDLTNPIGKLVDIYEDEEGIHIKVRISDSEDDLKIKIREGIYSELSIGFKVVKAELKVSDDKTHYIREIVEIKLYEVSLVTIARNERTQITDIKADIETLIDSVISKENNEEKKYQLLQIKSLLNLEPISSLENKKPITQKNGFDFDKINFIN